MSLTASVPYSRQPLRKALYLLRNFSNSHRLGSLRVSPESPSYVRLPTPPQSDEARPARIRGHLPVPRQIFPRREGDAKIQASYIEKTAPRSTQVRVDNNVQRWKAALADSRRSNLKDGLDALWDRRLEKDNDRIYRARRKTQQHNTAGVQVETEDDRLTRSTILKALMDTKVHPDPERFSRAKKSRSKVLALDSAKREARRDAIMELYTSASKFIVYENELKAEIDKVFTEDYFRTLSSQASRHGCTDNVWGICGKPPSIGNMIEASTGASTKLYPVSDLSVKRQKTIADHLTSGKME
ncbi:hypothetical protein E4U15_006041 [Claviceps sp. LM218 group G6]|nr:hypothetical protein E4U15_006041 [Claviceps sp. LM218 group G6]